MIAACDAQALIGPAAMVDWLRDAPSTAGLAFVGDWAALFPPDLLGLRAEDLPRLHDDRFGRSLDRMFEGVGPSATRRRSNGGGRTSGPTCCDRRGASAGCWFSRTRRGSTCCRGRSGLTPPWGRRRCSGSSNPGTTSRSWEG